MKTRDYLNRIDFSCDNEILTKAYSIALDDIKSNIKLFR